MSGIDGEFAADEWPTTAWRTVLVVLMGLLGAAVVVALVVTLGEANRQRDRALALQSHSFEVMILARSLSGTIARSEASLGRYVISGDKALGQLFSEEWRLAGRQITRLAQVTGDSATQQRLIGELRVAYEERGSELSLTALSTNYGKNNQALARYYQARKAPALARINTKLDEIIAHERALLETRTGDAMQSVAQSNRAARVLGVFGGLLLLGAIALGWLTVRALSQRAAARAEAERERERAVELEVAVTRATDELKQQESKLHQAQKMDAVGQLTGGIAHDFNNMLAVVLGGLELARRAVNPDESTAIRHIDSATEGANRAAALTRRLLAFSREEALRSEPINPSDLVAGMSDLLDRTLGDAVIVVIADKSDDWLIRSDRHQLENVILNLAVNARDAMDGRGTLTIMTSAETLAAGAVGTCAAGEYVTIAVGDTGCGMSPDLLERVFEPFFTTKAAGKGTGLGLSQAFAFARQAGGEVALDSTVGAGTTVTLYLPRERDAAQDEEAHATPPTTAPVGTGILDILVVEDDPRVLAATIGALEELGHRPVGCADPLVAPALLERHSPIDLIVSDVLMPGQTGPEMIAALTPRWGDIAVLFVTGYAGDTDEAALGGHHILRKPFTIAALEAAIDDAVAAVRGDVTQSIAAE